MDGIAQNGNFNKSTQPPPRVQLNLSNRIPSLISFYLCNVQLLTNWMQFHFFPTIGHRKPLNRIYSTFYNNIIYKYKFKYTNVESTMYPMTLT